MTPEAPRPLNRVAPALVGWPRDDGCAVAPESEGENDTMTPEAWERRVEIVRERLRQLDERHEPIHDYDEDFDDEEEYRR